MPESDTFHWESQLVSPREVLGRIKPGMTLFIGTGPALPRTLTDALMASDAYNARDLELVQLAGHGDILSLEGIQAQNYRLKTFFSGYVAWRAISTGRVDFIPTYTSAIPRIIKSRQISIDVAFIQITPPNESGYCSLGSAVDVAREVMEQASLVVGEVNPDLPFTYGDSFVSIRDFDLLVRAEHPPAVYPRWPVDAVMDQVAANVASVIRDGDCLCYAYGPLFEALVPHLQEKDDLGIHSLYFTDALRDLVKSGAVTNYRKSPFRGKSLASYAVGSAALHRWLDRNPLVEFQGIDWVCNPTVIGKYPQFVALYEAEKADLLGGIAFPSRGKIATGPGEVADFLTGAEISPDGCSIFALPSRNGKGEANILMALMDYPNQLRLRESVSMIVTEYGIASLKRRTLRERAQAMIDIAHPDDREQLVAAAREKKIIYSNQIFLAGSAHLYPARIATWRRFKGDVAVRFRAIKPSDEEAMRRFFYRFSEETIYYRFFYNLRTMAHNSMQEYVNVDYEDVMSIVGLHGKHEDEKIIAEARYALDERTRYGEVAFLVDEAFQGVGIGSYLMELLCTIARDQGLKGLSAEILAANKAMMKTFERAKLPMDASLKDGIYHIRLHFQ